MNLPVLFKTKTGRYINLTEISYVDDDTVYFKTSDLICELGEESMERLKKVLDSFIYTLSDPVILAKETGFTYQETTGTRSEQPMLLGDIVNNKY